MLNFLWCQNAKFESRFLFGTQIQFLEVDFFLEPKCKFRKSTFCYWCQNTREGNGRGGDGWILVAVQLGGGAKAGGFCLTPEVAANPVSIHAMAVGSRT